MAAPVGPVNAAQLDKGIKGGFMPSLLVGLGAIGADLIYMLIVYFGIVHFLEIPFMKAYLFSFGCFVLIYTGIEGLAGAGKVEAKKTRKQVDTTAKLLFAGFLIALLNPLNILFWLGIYGSVLAQTAEESSMLLIILYSSGIFLGLLIWDIVMAGLASSFRKFLANGVLKGISIFSGLSLIGFGVYFGVQAVCHIFF